MMVAPYNPEIGTDNMLPRMVSLWRRAIVEGDDDVLILNVGTTGSGKTNLSLIECTLYNPQTTPEQIALTKKTFAAALAATKHQAKGERVLLYDELELGKRSSMSNWNKDMMQLYFKIRGLNIFHAWNHPSLNQVDGEFIRERVNGIFFTYEKSKGRARKYYFFPKERILQFLRDHKKLHLETLKLHARKYALYQGYYKKYEGVLLTPYLAQKQGGMDEAVDDFVGKYGDNTAAKEKHYSLATAAKMLDISPPTLSRAVNRALKEGRLSSSIKNPMGMFRLQDEHIALIRQYLQEVKQIGAL